MQWVGKAGHHLGKEGKRKSKGGKTLNRSLRPQQGRLNYQDSNKRIWNERRRDQAALSLRAFLHSSSHKRPEIKQKRNDLSRNMEPHSGKKKNIRAEPMKDEKDRTSRTLAVPTILSRDS